MLTTFDGIKHAAESKETFGFVMKHFSLHEGAFLPGTFEFMYHEVRMTHVSAVLTMDVTMQELYT